MSLRTRATRRSLAGSGIDLEFRVETVDGRPIEPVHSSWRDSEQEEKTFYVYYSY